VNAKVFLYPLTIKENHLDSFEHVNNATYLNLFEQARWDMLKKNGYTWENMKETGVGPTILEIKITFLKELRLHDAIIIETQVISYKKKIGRLMQKMMRDGVVCCEAEYVMGFFDLRTRKLVLPMPELLQAFGIE